MRNCPVCNIKVGGSYDFCPLCQNELAGDKTDVTNYFPPEIELRKKSMVYKIQLFASVAAAIVAIVLDFVIGLHGRIHWSVISTSGVIVSQIVIKRLLRKSSVLVDYIINITVSTLVLLILFSHYLNFMPFTFQYVLPPLFIAMLGTMFGFFLADKKGKVLPYLITVTALCIIVPVVLIIIKRKSLLWDITLMSGLVSLAGLIIFKGSKLVNELHKRFHM